MRVGLLQWTLGRRTELELTRVRERVVGRVDVWRHARQHVEREKREDEADDNLTQGSGVDEDQEAGL